MHVGNGFLMQAHDLVKRSLKDVDEGRYGDSWAKMPPARLFYLLDTIQCSVVWPFVLVETLFALGEHFVTWGHQAQHFRDSAAQLVNLTNRVLGGSLGTVVSPTFAYYCRDSNIISGIFTALGALRPDRVYYIPGHGFSPGWRF